MDNRFEMEFDVFNIVFPVFIVIGLGFSLKKTKLLPAEFLYDMNRLIYFIALPALLFYKIGSADFKANFNGALLGGVTISVVLVFLLSYGYASLRGYSPQVKGAFCQGSFRGNLAFIGLAIIYSAFGEEGFAAGGILLGWFGL